MDRGVLELSAGTYLAFGWRLCASSRRRRFSRGFPNPLVAARLHLQTRRACSHPAGEFFAPIHRRSGAQWNINSFRSSADDTFMPRSHSNSSVVPLSPSLFFFFSFHRIFHCAIESRVSWPVNKFAIPLLPAEKRGREILIASRHLLLQFSNGRARQLFNAPAFTRTCSLKFLERSLA